MTVAGNRAVPCIGAARPVMATRSRSVAAPFRSAAFEGRGRTRSEGLGSMYTSPPALLILALLSLVLLAGCATPVNEPGALQRESLRHIYYRNGPLPPAPGDIEQSAAAAAVQNANPWERTLLTDLYPDDVELQAYAIRDTDSDGVHDFRVSDYYGRFLEGDTDVDGDGIDNVFDARPFVADVDAREELAAPATWTVETKPAAMAAIQRELLANHRVLLVERGANFTPELARAVEDVLTRVYRSIFADKGSLSSLRVIATEESSLLYADAEEGAGDFAQVFAATSTMEIYRAGIDALPLIQLGFLVHEIGHNIQFEMDFEARRRDEIMRRNVFVAEHFHALVAQYGWTTYETEADPESEFTLFRPQYVSPEAYGYLYYDETPEEWAAWLEGIYADVGEDDYLADARVAGRHILGDYSLTGPWEWYSDHLIAYVYLAMIDAVRDDCEAGEWIALRQALQQDVVRPAWPYFRYENARGAPIQQHFAETFPLDPEDVDYLADRYLGELVAEYCD